MQFEEFDNKVRQAADHHHPAYDQDAWVKMEKLLDKHMPQEGENKRRFIFFLLFFLLIGGGTWLVINQPWKKGSRVSDVHSIASTNNKTEPINISQPITSKTGTANINQPSSDKTTATNTDQHSTVVSKPDKSNQPGNPTVSTKSTVVSPVNKVVVVSNQPSQKTNNTSPIHTQSIKNKPATTFVAKNENRKIPVETKTETATNNIPQKNLNAVVDNDLTKPAIITQQSSEVETTTPVQSEKKDAVKNESPVVAMESTLAMNDKKTDKQKTKTKKQNTFFLSLSAGPDMSFVSSDKAGTTKILVGGGVGFTLHDKLTFRTGFYSGRKVYSSSPYNYNPPASFWSYYPYMQNVEANCKVYEIPVSVSYNFGKKANHHWFAGAGISSLLMKKETYDYFYKTTPTSAVYSKQYSISNQNKHYFSIVTLSAGYQKMIGKHVSLTAEPYFKLPLTGIGYGKVKLNSGGIMLTVAVNPFSLKKSTTKNSH